MCRIKLTTIQYKELPEVVQKLETIILTCLEHTLASVAHSDKINSLRPSDAYMSVIWPSLVENMACRLVVAKPLFEPMLNYC